MEAKEENRNIGTIPPFGDYLRPAALKAGVIAENDPCRFGFHNLRHSLASFLVRSRTDPKTVQALLRHSDVKTTLQLYAHTASARTE